MKTLKALLIVLYRLGLLSTLGFIAATLYEVKEDFDKMRRYGVSISDPIEVKTGYSPIEVTTAWGHPLEVKGEVSIDGKVGIDGPVEVTNERGSLFGPSSLNVYVDGIRP